jgi:hypothetical protein
VPAPNSFDYAVVRVVPRVDREEFINAGVVLYCLKQRFLKAQLALEEGRLLALAPGVDLPLVRSHLQALQRVCEGGPDAGPIGQLPQKERWHWVVAPRSTIIQVSPVHSGLCEDPEAALADLVTKMVLPPEK